LCCHAPHDTVEEGVGNGPCERPRRACRRQPRKQERAAPRHAVCMLPSDREWTPCRQGVREEKVRPPLHPHPDTQPELLEVIPRSRRRARQGGGGPRTCCRWTTPGP